MADQINILTITEIEEILSSKKFISSIKRNALEARLVDLQKEENEKFPTLIKETTQIENNIKNFSSIINETISQQNNTITLNFDEIKRLYHYYSIYRIKLLHVTLKNKIFMLNSMVYVKNPYASLFKSYFEYDKMMHQENNFNACLNICSGLSYIEDTLKYISNKQIFEIKYLKIKEININKLEPIFVDQFVDITNKLLLLKDNNDKLMVDKIIDDIKMKIDALEKNMIDYCNPSLNCEYLVEIDCSGNIMPIGIYNNHYIDCDEYIDKHYSFYDYQSKKLKSMKIDDLILLFGEKCKIDGFNNFFSVKVDNNDFYVRYNVVDSLSKVYRGNLEITNYDGLPYLASTWFIINEKKINTKQINTNQIKKNINYHSPKIKYIFDELNNTYPNIIKTNMYESFDNLAYCTSRI